jgi:putative phosphoesterase
MRVAVIADTHMPRGTRELPRPCLERLAAADLILHAGDLTGISFYEELCALGPPVEAVHGNIDEPALQTLLPRERVVEVADVRIGMVHIGGPRPWREERLVARFPGCAAVVYGHTHVPQADRVGDLWILNPGSPIERRSAPARSMLELTVSGSDLVPELVHLDP